MAAFSLQVTSLVILLCVSLETTASSKDDDIREMQPSTRQPVLFEMQSEVTTNTSSPDILVNEIDLLLTETTSKLHDPSPSSRSKVKGKGNEQLTKIRVVKDNETVMEELLTSNQSHDQPLSSVPTVTTAGTETSMTEVTGSTLNLGLGHPELNGDIGTELILTVTNSSGARFNKTYVRIKPYPKNISGMNTDTSHTPNAFYNVSQALLLQNYSAFENSTFLNKLNVENSTNPVNIIMENSTQQKDVIMETSTAIDSETCIIRYGFTANNLSATVDVTDAKRFQADLKCFRTKWGKWMSANSTRRLHRSRDNISVDNLEVAKAAVSVWMYGSPILIAGGTLGNLLSFAVMLRKKIRHTTTSLYLIVLAVVDTAVLYTGLLRLYMKHSSGYDIRHSSALACKFHVFSVYATQQFDSWVLVSVTLERVCAVFLPHKSKEIFTKRFATVSLIIQALVIVTINSHFFYTHDLVYFRGYGEIQLACTPLLKTHISYMNNIWPWIDFCLFSLVPFTIIISSNVVIVCRLLWSSYTRRHHLHATSDVKMTSMTAILITVSIVFFVTTAPISIYLIQSAVLHQKANVYQRASLAMVWAVLNMILYTNNAVNFLLYFISGPRFRKELKVMFCRKNTINPNVHTVTSYELQNA